MPRPRLQLTEQVFALVSISRP